MTAETTGQASLQNQSAFAPENYRPVSLIMLMRLYDIGIALLSIANPKKADEIIELHRQGHTFTPPPAFLEQESE